VNAGPERSTLIAFLGIVILGGFNGISIRLGNAELAPFWGAALRFALAAAVFFAIVAVRHVPLPRGGALVGSVLYGVLGFGVTYALVYYGLVEAPAGLAQVTLALVPLLTLLLAVVHGIERFKVQSAAGSLLAIVGVGLVFSERMGSSVPLVSLLAILAAAFAIAEATVVVKRFPHSHPVANNAVAMAVGAALLLALSLLTGEPKQIPSHVPTLLALAYLVLIGSVVVFTLYLIVIERWTASATTYSLLLMPLVSVVAAAVLLNEPITPLLVVGGGLVLAGVYVGAFAPSAARPLPGLFHRPRPAPTGLVVATEGPPTLISPNCP